MSMNVCILTDFFDDEQLFLILEFEFGGSDLENMKGKVGHSGDWFAHFFYCKDCELLF